MIIAIEGLDAVGKTTTAKKIAELNKIPYVEKPWSIFLDKNGEQVNYQKLTKQINNFEDPFFRMCFYSLGSMIAQENYKDTGYVTDRHIISFFVHNQNKLADEWFKLLITKIGVPDQTFILYANSEIRRKRMFERNPHDNDLQFIDQTEKMYKDIKEFLSRFEIPNTWVDTSHLNADEVVQYIQDTIHK